MSTTLDTLIANLINEARSVGFCQGRGIDDRAAIAAEIHAMTALKAEIEKLHQPG